MAVKKADVAGMASAVETKNRELKRYLVMAVAFLGLFLLSILPPPTGMQPEGLRAVGVLVLAIMLWVTEVINPTVTALMVVALLSLLGVLPFENAIKSFGTTSIWLLIGVFIVSASVTRTSLDKRIAYNIIRLARGNAAATLLMVITTTFVFTFIIPVAVARTVIMLPICMGLIRAMNLKPPSNLARSLMISVPFISVLSSTGLITGTTGMVVAAGLFESLMGYRWTYLSWMLALMPVALISCFMLWPLFLKLFPPEINRVEGGMEYVQEQLKALGPMGMREWKVFLAVLAMIALWSTSELHGVSISLVSLIVAIIMLMPGMELFKWEEAVKEISWDTVILFGSSLSLAEALKTTGTIDWFAGVLFSGVKGMAPLTIAAIILIGSALIRLGFTNITAMIVSVLPVAFALAKSAGINPVWLGMVVLVASGLCLFYPMQSIACMATYGTGYYSIRDQFKAGIWTSILLILLCLILARYYWPLIGFPIR